MRDTGFTLFSTFFNICSKNSQNMIEKSMGNKITLISYLKIHNILKKSFIIVVLNSMTNSYFHLIFKLLLKS